ncbi:hypothetical protein QMG61_02850 [Cryobacterium sp. PH31-AA6]|uniref:hypothetical protein n=1 Tax=Cryobacterium sp. PH31-AA6 TaxID=3046205 RepID=UPI0024BB089E|nr:hypothetical protein [Cryobacterium sp. PH31-AA6]MDJ0322702.1 hypothetical protein [Cryobacterium sp. PH31-AA6]
MTASPVLSHPSTAVSATFRRRTLAGVIGGLAGGLVFGMLMAMMGMLTVIASMVGSTSPWVGLAVHLMISVLIGLGLTVLFGNRLLTGYGRGALVGMSYGAIWWLLGPLVMMPLMLGMPVFSVDMSSVFSLMGHLIYGAILGLTAVRVLKSRA